MNPNGKARRLRSAQTAEERQLWLSLRAGRFAGFKFRRQHPVDRYILDFYCPAARLAVELDGFMHGMPAQMRHDAKRAELLAEQDIEELRFWNHQWRKKSRGSFIGNLECAASANRLRSDHAQCGEPYIHPAKAGSSGKNREGRHFLEM